MSFPKQIKSNNIESTANYLLTEKVDENINKLPNGLKEIAEKIKDLNFIHLTFR